MYLYEENGDKIELDQKYLEDLYDLLNREYFDGKLGKCEIGTFSGKNVRTLGYFKMADGTKSSGLNGRLFRYASDGSKQFGTSENFVELFKPQIKLNANYRWTEEQMEATMLHEMCHYWTFKSGWAPTQAHGTEFRNVAGYVSGKSDGKFDIKRLAGAEELSNLELRPELKASMDRKQERKSNNTYVVLIEFNNGRTMLSRTSTPDLILTDLLLRLKGLKYAYFRSSFGTPAKMEVFRNGELASMLASKGYSTNFRGKLKFWSLNSNEADEISRYPHKTFDFSAVDLDVSNYDEMAKDMTAGFYKSFSGL